MIYFDNAATTYPKPVTVRRTVWDAMVRYGANPGRSGHDMSIATAVAVTRTRELAAAMFDLPGPENVVFTQNCTYALNTAIQGLLQRGDHVIISDLEHNSVLRPVHTLAQAGLITYDIAVTVPGNDQATVNAFAALIGPKTKLMVCTHGSNTFGFLQPIQLLAQLARQRGVLLVVDAAQTAGVVEIPMGKWGVDYVCAAGHKSLYGPSGTGLLLINNALLPSPLAVGGTGSLSARFTQPDFLPDALESGTLNTIGVVGLGAGLEFVSRRTIRAIYAHEMELTHLIYRRLSHLDGVVLYGEPQLPVLSFNLEGLNGEVTAARLNERGFALRGGLHCAPLAHTKMGTMETGSTRLSVGAFNTVAQAEQFCQAVQASAKESC